ncbi:MAG TPA: SURF1 family cytochrome oxidase biogenesis protein, partial [Burkholderiaceae bacterium]|nr:SURF1 family cytochrome oxidase biogenesis protein [Burkholderiaceae bacterium]
PLRLLDASAADPVVLVLRGWAPRDARDRTQVPALPDSAAEPLAVEGVAVAQLSQLLALGRAQAPRALPAIWPNLDYADYEQASGLRVARMVVYQHPDPSARAADSTLIAATLQVAVGPATHYGYAVQWFALSVALAAWGAYLGWRAQRDGARRRGGPSSDLR